MRQCSACLTALVAISSTVQTVAEDRVGNWARFRGDNGSGAAAPGSHLPSEWNNQNGVLWKAPCPRGSSSPIIVGKQIIVTAYSGYSDNGEVSGERKDLTLHILSFDLASGKQKWDYSFAASDAEQEATPRVVDHGYASPTACSDGHSVFAFFGPSGVVACSLDGKELWRKDVGQQTAGFGAAASPMVWKNLLFVNASIESQTLYALNVQTGETVWKVDGIERSWTTPSIANTETGPELVIHFKNKIKGFAPTTGAELWHCDGIPDYIVPCSIVDGNTVYCSGGRSNRTIAVRAGGRGDVSESHKLWEVGTGANVTSPVLHNGFLYWSHDKAFALCVDAADGSTEIQKRFANRDRVYASVIAGDDKLYMLMRDGYCLVLEASPEYTEIAANRLGDGVERFNSTPAIVDNSLIFRSSDNLYRIAN